MNALGPLKKLISGASAASRELTGGIDQLRNRRISLLDERDRIASLPQPKEVVLAALDRDLGDLCSAGIETLSLTSLMRSDQPEVRIPQNGTLIALLVGLNRDAFRSQIAKLIEAQYKGLDVPNAEDRASQLADLDAEIGDLERAEEGLIREAERVGLPVLRRDDADPDALLLADGELGL